MFINLHTPSETLIYQNTPMRKFSLLSTLFLFSLASFAQDFSNKGKEFWLCSPTHVDGSNLATLSIFITSDKASSGTISMPNNAFSATFNIAANGIQEIQIPLASYPNVKIRNNESTLILKKSIHILVDNGKAPVVAYAQQWAGARSAATLLLPTNVLSTKYYAISFTQNGSGSSSTGDPAKSQFQIIAIKDNTTVQITPKVNGVLQAPFTVTLPLAGDLYQYQDNPNNTGTSNVDLTGSYIESLASGTEGCHPIAVFSGSSNTTFGVQGCLGNSSSYDPLWQQLYPVSTWGKNFGFIPFADYGAGNPYRVMASEDNTNVFFNGAKVATLNAGEIYPNTYTDLKPPVIIDPTNITADKPVCVAQYAQKQDCAGNGNSIGDPDMVILNPIEQNISNIKVFSSTNQAITHQWVNVLLKSSAVSSFTINGIAPTASWNTFLNLPGYSYLKQSLIGLSSATLAADSGFNAICYGFGAVESYAYSAGTNVIDLYTKLGVSSLYNIETSPAVCIGETFKFKISLPYLVDSIDWDFGAPPNPPSVRVKYPLQMPDSTTSINGKSIYWYSVPGNYNYPTVGTYPINIKTYSQNTAGCGNIQELDFVLDVSAPPTAAFTNTTPGCIAEQVQFTDATVSAKPVYKWSWNFGDPSSGAQNTSTLKNPVHIFSTPGNHTIQFSTITTAGCVSSTISKIINVPALPKATISGGGTLCQNGIAPVITFTGTDGTAPFIFTYHIITNGVAGIAQTITSAADGKATITAPINIAGTFVYSLDNIQNSTGTLCTSVITGQTATVKVNPLPTAVVSGTNAVCLNTTANITFTGAGSTAPYIFTYTIDNGSGPGTPQTIVSSGTGIANIAVPTNASGTFNYTLVSVKDASATACSQLQTGSAIVTVNPLPTATITGNNDLCLNATSPTVVFTGANGTAPYTFSYTLNNGTVQTIKTTTGNSIFISVPTVVADTFIYKLTSVQDASITACSQAQTGTATIIVHPLPTAIFNFSVPSCETGIINFDASSSIANAGVINKWDWNFDDAANSTTANPNVSTIQQPVHSFLKPGTYNVSLTVTTDNGCKNTISKVLTITPRPQAGFVIPEVCLFDPFAQFTDTSKVNGGGTITSWDWDFGDLTNSNPANPNTSVVKDAKHKYIAAGSYLVRLVSTSNTGCRDTLTQTLVVNAGNPIADFSLLNATANCASDSVAIQNKSSVSSGSVTRLEIYWDNIGNPTGVFTDETPELDKIYKHKYPGFNTPLTKTFNVRVRAFSGGVCFSDQVKAITVNATPLVVFNDLPNGCIDVPTYTLTQASETAGVPGTGVYSGDGVTKNISGVYTFNPALAGAGTHVIKYVFTSSAAGCQDSATKKVEVYPNPAVDAGPDAGILAGGSITLQPTVTGNNLTYVWSWNNGSINGSLSNPKIKNPVASPLDDITYTLTVTGTGGCFSSDDIFIKVLQAPKIPNTFSPNNDGINDFWEIKYLDTYPNNRVQVFTRTGQKVFESRGYKTPWNGTLNGKLLPVDTYYYIIEPESGRKPITGYVTIIK